jgi:hypothetical protein
LSDVRKGASACLSKEDLLDAAITANENPKRGNQNRYLEKSEIESGLKSLVASRRKREPEWYGSTVKAGKKLDPLLAGAMLYGRIIDILDGELVPTSCEPKNRIRTLLLDARDDHRGLYNAIIPLEEGGDPNAAESYFIERKMPGEKAYLYGPFPMPGAGLPEGPSRVDELEVFRTGTNRASYTFSATIGSSWKHDVEKIQIDEATRTVTIPWRVFRPNVESLGDGSLHHMGRDFRLPAGRWKVEMTDAITGRVLKRTTIPE